MQRKSGGLRPLRAKLIFNMQSGQQQSSPGQLAEIILEMERHEIIPEVYIVRQDRPVEYVRRVVRDALRAGIRLIVASGGDGTVESVVSTLIDTPGVLGVIPTGTRNNIAFNLGIPADIPGAVALLREGVRRRVDAGLVRSGRARHWFIEAASFGVISDLFPYADNLQKGDVSQLPSLVSTIVASAPADLQVQVDGRRVRNTQGLMALVTNMAYVGPHMQLSPRVSCTDGRLDIFLFPEMTQIDLLIKYAGRAANGNNVEDPQIKHLRGKEIAIRSTPPMPILADSEAIGQGPAVVTAQPGAFIALTGAQIVGSRVRGRREAQYG